MNKKLWVSVDKYASDVTIWDRPVNPDRDGDFCVSSNGNPGAYVRRFKKRDVSTECPPGECREMSDLPFFNEALIVVIPTVKPRTVEDVKEEIIKVLGEWVDEPGEPASSHGRRMTVLIHELRALQPKAWK